jgi:hypothetical protein
MVGETAYHPSQDLTTVTEDSPLLGRRSTITRSMSRSRRMRTSTLKGPHGNATVTQAVLMVNNLTAHSKYLTYVAHSCSKHLSGPGFCS